MAEPAAMALAAIVTNCLSMHQLIFLSDNQLLVQFLNHSDQANPPEWRIKHFTQTFTNFTRQRDARILRIQRSQNQMADILARQALI
jgi:ribonuclease HI